MAAKLSKEVTDRIRSSLAVRAALREQGPGVAEAMQNLVAPHLGVDDPAPSFAVQLSAYRKLLRGATDRLDAADHAIYERNLERDRLRQTRDQQFRRLDRQILGLRRSLRGLYLAPRFGRLGLAQPNPRHPAALTRQADLISDLVAEADLEQTLGEPSFEPPFDPRPHGLQIRQTSDDLRATLGDLDANQRQLDLQLAAKRQAMAAYDRTFLHVARAFEELCRFSGNDDLADKVRPSTRRPGRTHRELEEAVGGAGEADSRSESSGTPSIRFDQREIMAVEERPPAQDAAASDALTPQKRELTEASSIQKQNRLRSDRRSRDRSVENDPAPKGRQPLARGASPGSGAADDP
ncbi:MAG: hypothetical protein AAF657_39130 [Acidobacteriota bacterium]